MASIEVQAQDAEDAINAYETARATFADFLRLEMELEAHRAGIKAGAVARLMGEINPSSRDGKQHSASSAEAIVETDGEYAAYLLNQRNVVHAKNRAYTQAESAKLRASLAITLCKVSAGVL